VQCQQKKYQFLWLDMMNTTYHLEASFKNVG
jgi:hypothetical protein